MNSPTAFNAIAAIDLDGTLFGHDGLIGEENQAALERLAAAGFGIVLASGRHAKNMAEIARHMPLVRGLVSCQGCEASDPERKRIFVQQFLQPADVAPVVAAGLAAGFGVIAYTENGERTPLDGPDIDRYRRITATPIDVVASAALGDERVFKVMWIGGEAALDAFLARGGAEHCRPATAENVRSHREVFEFVPRGVSKATGAAALAREFGVPPARVVAFGDADNDVPLFDWAGFSVAMPHARAEVRRRATVTAPAGCAESAFARGVELVIAARFPGSST
ncbi:MAG TPA: HAD-IIB family hydrolase [Opitutaceae bacterium]|nr:HAD-IIB family hydrolase [Opitutaceae bacterium]